MLLPIAIAFLCFATFSVQSDEYLPVRSKRAYDTCYNEYGCFTTASPFGGTLQRPFALLPQSPSVIGTTFYLYTRETRKNRSEISRHTTVGVWNVTKPTKFLIHGFLDGMNRPWWIDMKNALLDAEDINVILTDWSKGNGFPYEQATANTQVVGVEVALFINHLIEEYGAQSADFHVIGHSLGGQTAGYVGQRVHQLARITGLDPAGPYFENTDPKVRLDSTDAMFVDVIHTDGSHNFLLGLGTLQRMGHVDFYPNGGYNQPNCPATSGKVMHLILKLGQMDVAGFMESSLCSHLAAVFFFIDTIRNKCPYIGYSCFNYDDFNSGKCSLQCDGNRHQCNRMGYWTSSTSGKGDLYLKTQGADVFPYCIYHYQITLKSGTEYSQTRGKFNVQLVGTIQTVTVVFDNDETVFKSGSNETRFFPSTDNIGDVLEVNIGFKKTNSLITSYWQASAWQFDKVTVLNGDEQRSDTFCPTKSIITSGSTVRFTSC